MRRSVGRARRGGCRIQRGHGSDLTARGGQHGGTGTGTVPDECQTVRVDTDSSRAQSHAEADVECGEQIGGQSDRGRDGPAFGAGRPDDEAPRREMLEQRCVLAYTGEPAVPERHRRQIEPLGGGIDHAGLSRERRSPRSTERGPRLDSSLARDFGFAATARTLADTWRRRARCAPDVRVVRSPRALRPRRCRGSTELQMSCSRSGRDQYPANHVRNRGYVGHRRALDVVVEALRRMEYRGYDSAGIAILDGRGGLAVRGRPDAWPTWRPNSPRSVRNTSTAPPGWATPGGRPTAVRPTATRTPTVT